MINYGVSGEMRSHILIVGNSSIGKTSFVRTFKQFSEHPNKFFPKSFLTGHQENKEFEKTKVLDVVKGVALQFTNSVSTESTQISDHVVMIHTKRGTEGNKQEKQMNFTFTDFGGNHEKKIQACISISNYYFGWDWVG